MSEPETGSGSTTPGTTGATESLRHIPIIPNEYKKSAFQMKWRVIKSVAIRNGVLKYFRSAKDTELPDQHDEDSTVKHSPEEKASLKKHDLALQILILAFQENEQLYAYINDSNFDK